MKTFASFMIFCAAVSSASADESAIRLKAAPDVDTVVANCSACHSLDYIQAHSFLTQEKWRAAVAKMIAAYGAPISEDDAKAIVDYLAKNYGT
jgi:cytochrome c5